MRWTELLEEVRKMRFEEAYGVCSRTFRSYTDRYEENGLEGLLDKRLTQASFRRTPVDEVMAVAERYKTRHVGWNVKHFYA